MSDSDSPGKFVFYNYNPSFSAACGFVALFTICTIAHFYHLIRSRTWYFIPFIIGGIFEAFGYVGRALSAKQSPNWTTGPYIMQSLLLLLGPTLFAASIYMTLGRLIRFLEANHLSIVRVTWLTKIFVLGDVLSFLAQSGGGGMLAQAKTASAVQNGEHIILGGLMIQVLFFGFFIITTALFHKRITQNPTSQSYSTTAPWKQFIYVLYAASVFIMVRSLYRVIEYAQGSTGSLQQTETYLYLLDALLMFATMVLFAIYHPSRVIIRRPYDKTASMQVPLQVAQDSRGGYEMA